MVLDDPKSDEKNLNARTRKQDEEDNNSNSHTQDYTSDLNIGTPVATLPVS